MYRARPGQGNEWNNDTNESNCVLCIVKPTSKFTGSDVVCTYKGHWLTNY